MEEEKENELEKIVIKDHAFLLDPTFWWQIKWYDQGAVSEGSCVMILPYTNAIFDISCNVMAKPQ